eukprot:GILI01009845.1.p1 GENE.GILI01009845.1~~GILI01009845.1.p1  ORF type:complete len:453 (-),score=142.84 GILI01009845.1:154-1464(-)
MTHLAGSSNSAPSATYVVQVYSTFSPPHLTPLLVRLAEGATVQEAIHASLSKLLSQDSSVVLPSDLVDEYVVRCAGGEGQPLYQSLPFDHSQVLREATGLEFPFMIHLGYSTARNTANGKTTGLETGNPDRAGGVLGGAGHKHVPLSAIEKAAFEAHRREIEARRAENVKQIERRRFEQQLGAFHHSENYELKRKEDAAKREAAVLKQEQERALQDQEAALTAAREEESRRAQLEAVKKGNERVVEQMRQEMNTAIAGDAKRREDLAEALEIRRREQAREVAISNEKKRLLLEAQKQQRTDADFDSIIGDLHKSIDTDVSTSEASVGADRGRRQLFQRANEDSHAIALVEQQRNYIKLGSRQDRKGKDMLDAQRYAMLLQQQEAAHQTEEERKATMAIEWQSRQEANREHATTQIESQILASRLGTAEENSTYSAL